MGRGKPSGSQHQSGSAPPQHLDLPRIIQGADVDSTRLLVQTAQEWGEYLADEKLTSSQIRGIFGQVRQIEMSWPSDVDDPQKAREAERSLILLKPKLAYQARRDAERNKNEPVSQLARILSPAIDSVKGDRGNFQRFVDFFEAILAYHRAAGGK